MEPLLSFSNLSVAVDKKQILNNVSFVVESSKVHALMGQNGSGKSSLSYTAMGHPFYQVKQGSIFFNGVNITHMSPEKRAQMGLFLSFQSPYSLTGVSVFSFLKASYNACVDSTISVENFNNLLKKKMDLLDIDVSFVDRDVNVGFSGGEKKRLEMLQLLLLQPKVAILDELDSGLDIDALKIVAHGLKTIKQHNPDMAIIIITHYQKILEYIQPDFVHIMHQGSLVASADASLLPIVQKEGYSAFI